MELTSGAFDVLIMMLESPVTRFLPLNSAAHRQGYRVTQPFPSISHMKGCNPIENQTPFHLKEGYLGIPGLQMSFFTAIGRKIQASSPPDPQSCTMKRCGEVSNIPAFILMPAMY